MAVGTDSDENGENAETGGSARRVVMKKDPYIITEPLLVALYGPLDSKEAAGMLAVEIQDDTTQLNYMARDKKLADTVRTAAHIKILDSDLKSAKEIGAQQEYQGLVFITEGLIILRQFGVLANIPDATKATLMELIAKTADAAGDQVGIWAVENITDNAVHKVFMDALVKKADAHIAESNRLDCQKLLFVAKFCSDDEARIKVLDRLVDVLLENGKIWEFNALEELVTTDRRIPAAVVTRIMGQRSTMIQNAVARAERDGDYELFNSIKLNISGMPSELARGLSAAFTRTLERALQKAIETKDEKRLWDMAYDHTTGTVAKRAEIAYLSLLAEKEKYTELHIRSHAYTAGELLTQCAKQAAGRLNFIDAEARRKYVEAVKKATPGKNGDAGAAQMRRAV